MFFKKIVFALSAVQTRKKTSTPFSQRKSSRRTYTSDDSPANNKLSDRSPPQLSKTSSKKISNGYSDDSDDANDSRGSWVQVSSAVTNTSPGLFSSSPNSFVSKRRSLRNRSLPFGNLLRDQDSPTPTKSPENNDVEPDKLDSVVPPSFKHPDPYESPLTVKKETRNGGDLVRRRVLTQAMKQNSLKKSKTQISNNSSPNTHNSSPNSSSPSWSRSLLRRLRSPSRSSPDSTRLAWPLRCSVLIPFCFVGFFVILGLLYVTMRTDDVTSRLPNLSSTTPMVSLNKFFFCFHKSNKYTQKFNVPKYPTFPRSKRHRFAAFPSFLNIKQKKNGAKISFIRFFEIFFVFITYWNVKYVFNDSMLILFRNTMNRS